MKTDTPIPEEDEMQPETNLTQQEAPVEETPSPEALSPMDEAATEVPGETTEPTENADAITEKILRFFPDADVSTPEAKLAAADRLLGALIPIHDKVYDLAETSPEAAATLNDWMETGSLPKAIARNYDPEEVRLLVDEINDASYDEDRNTFSQKNQQRKERETKLKGNLEISLTEIATYMEEKKDWDEKKADEFAEFVKKHYEDGWDGLIGKKDLSMLEKGFVYDDAVADAETNGKIAGRNEQIIEGKKSKKDLEKLLPELSGGGATAETDQKPENSFMSGLKSLADKKPILS
jgi:hypothetical protein